MSLEHVTAHVDEALANLLEQFKGKSKLEAALTAYVDQIQDLEDAFYSLLLGRWLDNADTDALDQLGAIVGEARQGRYNEDYRLAIRARILINLCEGSPEQIIQIFVMLAESAIDLREYFPAALVLTILDPLIGWMTTTRILISRNTGDILINRDGDILIGIYPDSSSFASLLYSYLQTVKPAGVKAQLRYWFSPEDEIFRFDSGPGWDQGKWAGAL
jgi:hypothetical protein